MQALKEVGSLIAPQPEPRLGQTMCLGVFIEMHK